MNDSYPQGKIGGYQRIGRQEAVVVGTEDHCQSNFFGSAPEI